MSRQFGPGRSPRRPARFLYMPKMRLDDLLRIAYNGDRTFTLTPNSHFLDDGHGGETGMKILIIEDSPEITETLSVVLQLNWPGSEINSAIEGRKGIQMLKDSAYDFAILDIHLPDTDGFNVLAEVRRFSTVPIFIVTVRGGDADRKRGMALGANDYISKPFKAKDLTERIGAVLGRTPKPVALTQPS